jgi:hypothetical protein
MKTVLAALALLSATVVSPLVGQGDDETTRKTLAGLKGVYVSVETISDDARRTQSMRPSRIVVEL